MNPSRMRREDMNPSRIWSRAPCYTHQLNPPQTLLNSGNRLSQISAASKDKVRRILIKVELI